MMSIYLLAGFLAAACLTASVDATTGYLRFFGPVSAGCANVNISVSSSMISVPSSTNVILTPTVNCTDLWTGLPLPFAIAADSPTTASGSFSVNAVTVISATAPGNQPGTFAYNQLSNQVWNVSSEPQLVDVIGTLIMPGGPASFFDVQSTLATDISWIGLNNLVSQAFLFNSTLGGTTTSACNTPQYVNLVLSNLVGQSEMPVDLTSPSSVMSLVGQLGAFCKFSNTAAVLAGNLGLAVTTLSRAVAMGGPAMAVDIANSPWPLQDLIFLSKIAKLASNATIAALAGASSSANTAGAAGPSAFDVLADSVDVPYAMIASTFNLTFSRMDLALTIRATGPISLAEGQLMINDVTSQQTTSPATPVVVGKITLIGALHSILHIPAGANDLVLQNPATLTVPVPTQVGTMAVLPFGASALTITPMTNMVTAMWVVNQMRVGISVPTEADYKRAYETIIGGSTVYSSSYSTRSVDGASAGVLALQVAEMLVSGLPSLGGVLIGNMLQQDPTVTASLLYAFQVNMSLGTMGPFAPYTADVYSNKTLILNALVSVYGDMMPQSPLTRRSLLAAPSLAQLTAVFTAASQIMADASSLVTDVLAQVQAGGDFNTLFTKLTQYSKLQATAMSTALSAVAAAWSSGDYTAAVTAATAATATFTKAAQEAAAVQLVVNPAADPATVPPVVTMESKSKGNALAIGLGVGLGVGLAAIAAVAVAVVVIQKRRAAKVVAPAEIHLA